MQNDDVSSSGGGVDELIVCPSFSTYYSDRQAAADRAIKEASETSSRQPRSELDEDEFGFATGRLEKSDSADEDEFEFSILCDESFPEGEIGQIFPIFDRDLVGTAGAKVDAASVSLKKLFIDEEREADGRSESESEADELESVEPGTYCVWRPSETPTLSPGRCKKSKSTGSCSKRWKFRDLLLRRSNSDGKESFVYMTTTTTSSSSTSHDQAKCGSVKPAKSGAASAHEVFYVKNRAVKEEDRRRSYLPYRKGLVGFGFFPNGMGFRPF